jgi:hypothetical protein
MNSTTPDAGDFPGWSDEEIAIHESGHAVAAWTLAVPIYDLTMVPDAKAFGMLRTIAPPSGPRSSDIVRSGVIALAGPAATFHHRRAEDWYDPGVSDDVSVAWRAIDRLVPSDEERVWLFRELYLTARGLVRHQAHRTLSTELLRRRVLPGLEVAKVLGQARLRPWTTAHLEWLVDRAQIRDSS